MYDIKELETKWKLYQSKRRRPLYIGVSLFVLLLFFVYYVYVMKYNISSFVSKSGFHHSQTTAVEQIHTAKVSRVLLNDTIINIEKKEKVDKLRNVAPVEPIEEIPILEEQTQIVDNRKSSYTGKQIHKATKRQRKHKKINLHIVETTSVRAYKDVERRFYQTHDIADSLFLAKGYYSHRNYKKAEYWALQTNRINQNIEESWIIFAKSKWKQGQKNEAIRILESYLKRARSKAARNLLEKLKK